MTAPDFTPEQLAAARKLLPDWEAFCPYETAAKMKELGYNEPGFFDYYYDPGSGIKSGRQLPHIVPHGHVEAIRLCAAPTLAQAARWLREKHQEHPSAEAHYCGTWIALRNGGEIGSRHIEYPTYEDALLAAIDRALDIVQQRQTKEE